MELYSCKWLIVRVMCVGAEIKNERKIWIVITLLYICGGVSHDSRMKLSFARNED